MMQRQLRAGGLTAAGRLLRRPAPIATSFRNFVTEEGDKVEEPIIVEKLELVERQPTTPDGKSGSPSPWAVFGQGDAWGADYLQDSDGSAFKKDDIDDLLSDEAVALPYNPEDFKPGVNASPTPSGLPDVSDVLDAYEKQLQQRSGYHFGYPYNLMHNNEELHKFMRYSINNLGDPFLPSNYGVHSRQFEVAVIDFFAKLWKMEEGKYWGYVTTCGTEGNLHGMLLARELLPDGVVFSSRETHYSIFKAARYYRMDAVAVDTRPTGEIDYDQLEVLLSENKRKGLPAIINVNIGTTVKGAVDNLDRILRILTSLGYKREEYYIHCDGALFAMMMPFLQWAPEVSFEKPIDSIAVSGHKMLGCPMPCGVTLTHASHVRKVEKHIEYLNSVDTTIMGSRNGHAALHMWYALRVKGVEGIKGEVQHCMDTAIYLRDKLKEAHIICRLNDLSCTVVMERPVDEAFVQRWQLACESDIAHVVVMPNIVKSKIDVFVKEFVTQRDNHGVFDVEEGKISQKDKLSSW